MYTRDFLTDLCNRLPDSHAMLKEALLSATNNTIANPSLSLKKSNIALGIIVRDLYEKEMHEQVANISIRTLLLNKLFIERIYPRRIYLLMDLVRKITSNPSNDATASKSAKIVIDYLTDIVEWYTHRLQKGEKLASSVYDDGIEPPAAPQTLSDFDFAEDDFEAAAKWFLVAAQDGNASAQYNLGVLYNHGRGVKQSYEEAVKWYTLAA